MLIAILQHTPVWVWALLAALIALGLWQRRDRQVSPLRVNVLPLAMIVLSASGVLSAFGHLPIALGAWVVGVVTALVLGRRVVAVRGARWLARSGLLHVPGSWLPLVLIVGLFCVKYFVGVQLGMHPALHHDTPFAACAGLAYGGFSGLFLARGLSLRGLATRAGALGTA